MVSHISEEQCKILRPKIKELVVAIQQVYSEYLFGKLGQPSDIRNLDGTMNYTICRLLIEVFDLKNHPQYTKFNTVDGILTQVGRAIYEGLVSPYEQKKIEENGNALLE